MLNLSKNNNSIYRFWLFAILSAIAIASPELAFAGRTGKECGISDGSVGWAMCSIADSVSDIPGLLSVISYIAGLIFGYRAIFKIKDHVADPNNTKLDEPAKYVAASGSLLSLPFILGILKESIYGHKTSDFSNTFFGGVPSAGGLDAVLYDFVADIFWPMHHLVEAFCYIAAIILVLIVLVRLVKDSQEGAKGPAGMGTIATLFIAGILFSVDGALGAFSESMFQDEEVTTAPLMLFLTGADAGVIASTHAVASASIAFFWLIGLVAFVRGWFILKEVAEGDQQASFMAGATHIIGGALCVNMGPLLNAIQITLGIWFDGVQFV